MAHSTGLHMHEGFHISKQFKLIAVLQRLVGYLDDDSVVAPFGSPSQEC
jgi:hypothetical protein